jgi:hypothetical protein
MPNPFSKRTVRAVVATWACILTGSILGSPVFAVMPSADESVQQVERYWNFKVLLDDREIGYHEFRVVSVGSTERVQSNARFDVKILFFNAYSYRHSNAETWRNGCLTRIQSSTDANGDRTDVEGNLVAAGFELHADENNRFLGDGCVRTFAYWNPSLLRAESLLNAQTGELMPVSVAEYGADLLQVGDREIPTRRLQITLQEGVIDLWYHLDTGRWLALEAPTEGGRTLRYEPASLPLEVRDDERLAME